MDWLGDLFNAIRDEFGLLGAVLSAVCIYVMVGLCNRFSGPFVDRLLKRMGWRRVATGVLLKHTIFAKYHYLLTERLRHLDCQCVLRKRIFCDLMEIRVRVYDQSLRKFIQEGNITSLDYRDFQFAATELVMGIFNEWEKEALDFQIPPVVIRRFKDSVSGLQESVIAFIQSPVSRYYDGDGNLGKMNSLLDVISGFEEFITVKLENELDDMNGEISGCEYKGLVCQHCLHCVSHHAKPKTE